MLEGFIALITAIGTAIAKALAALSQSQLLSSGGASQRAADDAKTIEDASAAKKIDDAVAHLSDSDIDAGLRKYQRD